MAEHSETVGRVTRVWVATVRVGDLEREIRFYRDVLGLPIVLDARPNFAWVELGPEEPLCKIGLNGEAEPEAPDRSARSTGIVLETDDLEALVARLKAAGVRFTREPRKAPWGGTVADFLDPEGNELEVVFDPGHYRSAKGAQPAGRS